MKAGSQSAVIQCLLQLTQATPGCDQCKEYLAQHGLKKFFQWYDYMSWYPIGRPIGAELVDKGDQTRTTVFQQVECK